MNPTLPERTVPALMKTLAISVLAFLPAFSAVACDNQSGDPAEVVQAQVKAYNAHDIATFASCYADNVTVTDLSGKRPVVSGVEALKKAYAFLDKVPKAFHVDIVERVVHGPVVIDKERVMGLPADKGQPEALAVYEVRNGKIQNLWLPPRE